MTDRPDHSTESGAPRGPHRDHAAMPEVLAALERSIERGRAPRRRSGRVLRGTGLGVLVALVSGSALAVAGQWDPLAALHGSDPESFSLTSPPARQLDSLAVLRRPQTAKDRDPLVLAFLGRTSKQSRRSPEGDHIRLRYVRLLRTVESSSAAGYDGRWHFTRRRVALFLIPRERLEGADAPEVPARFRLGRDPVCAWTVEDSWPEGADRPAMALPDDHAPRPAKLADRVSGGGTCVTIQQVRVKGLLSGAFNYGALYGLVPDGVAVVRATTKTGQVITSKVVNNSFELLAPGRATQPSPPERNGSSIPSGQFKHQSVEWLDASGQVIRHISQ